MVSGAGSGAGSAIVGGVEAGWVARDWIVAAFDSEECDRLTSSEACPLLGWAMVWRPKSHPVKAYSGRELTAGDLISAVA